jgi:PAS domain S-box-containing protein
LVGLVSRMKVKKHFSNDELALEERDQLSEDLYYTLFETTAGGVIIVDDDGTILLANTSFCNITGYEKDELERKVKLFELVHPDDLETIVKYHRLRRENSSLPPKNYEVRMVDKYGAIHEMFISVDLIPNTRRGVVSGLDITQHKERERELRRSNQMLTILNEIIKVSNSSLITSEVLENSLEKTIELLNFDMGWIYLKNPDGRRAELCAHYGVPEYFATRNATINTRDWPNNMIFFAGQTRFVENLPKHPPGLFDTRILEEVDALAFAAVPLIANSVVVGALFVGKIQECIFSEDERFILSLLGNELGGSIIRAMLQDQLENAYDEAMFYIDVMVNDIKQNNLDALRYANLLKNLVTREASTYVDTITKKIEQGTEVINNIITVQKMGDEHVQLFAVDLDAIIEGEVSQFPTVRIHHKKCGAYVWADDLLAEVFINIIGNSIKFGGPDVEIWIRANKMDDFIVISVEDTGPGIPDEKKDAIFYSFRRDILRPTGRGLGLYIVRLLVERYGGIVRLEDRVTGKPSKGLAVRFNLKTAPNGS